MSFSCGAEDLSTVAAQLESLYTRVLETDMGSVKTLQGIFYGYKDGGSVKILRLADGASVTRTQRVVVDEKIIIWERSLPYSGFPWGKVKSYNSPSSDDLEKVYQRLVAATEPVTIREFKSNVVILMIRKEDGTTSMQLVNADGSVTRLQRRVTTRAEEDAADESRRECNSW